MNKALVSKASIAGLLLTTLLSASAMADVHVSAGVVLDNRHGHNHYYPPPGAPVRVLPRDAYPVRFHDTPYYFRGGIWYRHAGPGFVVARPPIGVTIGVLPPFYTTVWFGGVPYYYADNVYYRWDPAVRGYVVSAPPDGSPYDTEVDTTPSPTSTGSSGDVFIYPKNGQSEEQQATDRYECHRWAADQTGFDPTKSQGGVNANEVNGKRADYQRAQSACLEGRGYTVK